MSAPGTRVGSSSVRFLNISVPTSKNSCTLDMYDIAAGNCLCLTSNYATSRFVEARGRSQSLKVLRACRRVLLITSAGIAAYLISSSVFAFVIANLLHVEDDPMRRASLQGTLGFSFSALLALISAYLVSRVLKSGGSTKGAAR